MDLSMPERLMLYNQFSILQQLSGNEGDKKLYQYDMDILLNGFESEYDRLVGGFLATPLFVCNEVKSILHMFRCLNDSYEALSDKSDIEPHSVKFQGFDGNEEADYCAFAKWYITDERYSEFKNQDANSHCNKLNGYRAMLRVFNSYEQNYQIDCFRLSIEQIKKIISGR